MSRTIAALALSLIVHVVVLANMTLPVARSEHPERVRLRIPETPMADAPEEPAPVIETIEEIERAMEAPIIDRVVGPVGPVDDESEEVAEEGDRDEGVSEGNEGPDEEVGSVEGQGNVGGEGSGIVGDSGPDEEGSGESNDVTEGEEGEGQSVGSDVDRILAEYRAQVLAAVSAHKVYPAIARRLGREGSVRVRFRVVKDGLVSSVEVTESSGYSSLDDAARSAVEDASPVPAIPEELGEESLVMSLLIVFSLD